MAQKKNNLFFTSQKLAEHYNQFPYPSYPLLASIPAYSTYHLHVRSLFQSIATPLNCKPRILLAGCGTFSPYSFALANPSALIHALDLSKKNIQQAQWRLNIHRISTPVCLKVGDLLNPDLWAGPYDFIDAYGVLHHLQNPEEGLKALSARLRPGGLMRVMLYSQSARKPLQALKRALKLISCNSPKQIAALLRLAPPHSHLAQVMHQNSDLGNLAGIADALFNPCEHFFDQDDLFKWIKSDETLEFVRFMHQGSNRAGFELAKQSGNFIFLLQKKYSNTKTIRSERAQSDQVVLHPRLNTILQGFLNNTQSNSYPTYNRLGKTRIPFTQEDGLLLHQCAKPIAIKLLSPLLQTRLDELLNELILLPVN